MKIRPVGAELFHADGRTEGQTYMTELIFAFRNFSNAHKNKSYPKTSEDAYCINLSEPSDSIYREEFLTR
jgi:hypothetical protein